MKDSIIGSCKYLIRDKYKGKGRPKKTDYSPYIDNLYYDNENKSIYVKRVTEIKQKDEI